MPLKRIPSYYLYAVFLLLVSTLTAKQVLFHRACFGSPCDSILLLWLNSLAAPLIIASFVFLFRRQWWIVVPLILMDLWVVANLLYFRANNLFLTLDVIRMAGNMRGFESSVGAYADIHTWIIPATTVVCLALVAVLRFLVFRNQTISSRSVPFAVALLAGICCSLLAGQVRFKVFHKEDTQPFSAEWLNPFVLQNEMLPELWQKERQPRIYLTYHSISAYAVNMIYEGRLIDRERKRDVVFSDVELARLAPAFREKTDEIITPSCNLVIVFVESFESWLMEMRDADGNEVTPCINDLRRRYPNLFFPRVKSQVGYAMSGDGLMILNTGLLPIQNGAACMMYSNNTWPGFAHLYSQNAVVNPIINSWNKTTNMLGYGYNELLQPVDSNKFNPVSSNNLWKDKEVFEQLEDYVVSTDSSLPYCAIALTISTHTPWDWYDFSYKLPLKEEWQGRVPDYIGAMHYADHCFGEFLKHMEQRGLLDNTMLVITGDHNIFREESMIEPLIAPAKQAGLSIADGQTYVPLILVGKGINETRETDDIVYQMDIYPTIMSLIGAGNYFWQGFGIDLSRTPLPERQVTVPQSYYLSDKLIRADYFGKRERE